MIVFALFGWRLGRQADRLIELSTTDGLTGLLNARGFYRQLHHELARAGRSRQPLSIVALDLDGLKRINDRQGHEAGDRALRAVAETMRETLRTTDIGARVGGDEFTVLAPNTNAAAALTLAERIRTRAADPRSPLALLAATVSLGVVTFDPSKDTATDAAALMRTADDALYDAKRGGGNRAASGVLPRCGDLRQPGAAPRNSPRRRRATAVWTASLPSCHGILHGARVISRRSSNRPAFTAYT
jgi:two-component system cell cycle response regulator